MAGRPTGRPHPMLKFWQDRKNIIDAWRKSQMVKEDEDETTIIGESMMAHVKGSRNQFKNILANRPTGRPLRLSALLADLKMKYKEALQHLKGMRPTGRPSRADRRTFQVHSGKLTKHFRKVRKQVKKQAMVDEDETAILFGRNWRDHWEVGKARFDKFMMNRPTGRPSFLKAMHMKWTDMLKNLQAKRPTGRPI